MRFHPDVLPYLQGDKFSNAIKIQIAQAHEPLEGRLEFLANYCTGKKVVHLGCTDHEEIIDEKIKKNNWLHKLLIERTSRCIGVDINEPALAHIKKLGYEEVYYADITNQPPLEVITLEKWDCIVMGEIIEHIGDPVSFLSALRERYASSIDSIVLSTPHAFRFKNFSKAARNNLEIVNSDHRFWFTPYTLAKIAVDAGLYPDEFWLVENMKPTKGALFKKWLLCRYPAYRDTIIMTCRLNP